MQQNQALVTKPGHLLGVLSGLPRVGHARSGEILLHACAWCVAEKVCKASSQAWRARQCLHFLILLPGLGNVQEILVFGADENARDGAPPNLANMLTPRKFHEKATTGA